jgi:cyclomaltodextrinase
MRLQPQGAMEHYIQILMNFHRLTKGLLPLAAALVLFSPSAKADADVSGATARTAPDWLRGVIYEIFPRDFSPTGNLAGVTARLDGLKKLGVTILWIMPIQPIGEKFRKGEFGSPYSISDYYAVDPELRHAGRF